MARSRPFFAGEEKRARYNLFAHARDSQEKLGIRIFSVYFLVVFRYIPAYVQRMMAESDVCGCCCVSEQTLYIQDTSRRLVYMHVRRYAPRSHSQRLNDSKLVYFSGYVFRTLRLYVNRLLRFYGISCACANRLYQADGLGTRLQWSLLSNPHVLLI